MVQKKILVVLLIMNPLFWGKGHSARCVLPKLGMFDCGDGDCISTDQICDNKIDCPTTSKDELNCEDHFRRRCLINRKDNLLNVENYINSYLGYNIISGLAEPFMDWHHVDAHIRRHVDCRRAEIDKNHLGNIDSLPLLPHNVANFTYVEDTNSLEFQLFIFESAYDAFIDLKKRKSIEIKSDINYEQLKSIILSDAYKTTNDPGANAYWMDEQLFWQANTPFVRLHTEKIIGKFALRSNDRLELNPELIPNLINAIRRSNASGDANLWSNFFARFGTHFPIAGSVGGSIEIIAKRKLCPQKNATASGAAHVVSMTEIGNCLLAKIKKNSEEEKSLCGKLEKKFNVPTISEAIDWSYRKVIGGDPLILTSNNNSFPSREQLENWGKTIQTNARALSTNLMAVCELIDRFTMENRKNETNEDVNGKKLICQRALLAYVKEKDVLHIQNPSMIPCRKNDAVPVWRFIEKKFILRGLPWCLSTTNVEGSCPAPAALSVPGVSAKLSGGNGTMTNSGLVTFNFFARFSILITLGMIIF